MPGVYQKARGKIQELLGKQDFEPFGQKAKHYVWHKPNTVHHSSNIKHDDGSIMFWSCFSEEGTGKLVASKANMNGAKYKQIVEENLFQSARHLCLGQKSTFQQNAEPKHRVKREKRRFGFWKAQTSIEMEICGMNWKLLSASVFFI